MRKTWIFLILLGWAGGMYAIAEYPTFQRMPTLQSVDAPEPAIPPIWIQIGISAVTVVGCWIASSRASSKEAGKLEGKVLTMLTAHHEDIKDLWKGKVDFKFHENCKHAIERELGGLKTPP